MGYWAAVASPGRQRSNIPQAFFWCTAIADDRCTRDRKTHRKLKQNVKLELAQRASANGNLPIAI
jgi:hypothetical protein